MEDRFKETVWPINPIAVCLLVALGLAMRSATLAMRSRVIGKTGGAASSLVPPHAHQQTAVH